MSKKVQLESNGKGLGRYKECNFVRIIRTDLRTYSGAYPDSLGQSPDRSIRKRDLILIENESTGSVIKVHVREKRTGKRKWGVRSMNFKKWTKTGSVRRYLTIKIALFTYI